MIRRPSRRTVLRRVVALGVTFAIAPTPHDVLAQRAGSPRHIGVLLGGVLPEERIAQAFRDGLLDAGYAEGRDLVIQWRSAKDDQQQLLQLADELVRRKVDVIVVASMPAAQAAKRVTSVIPIVLGVVADPISAHLVPSLAHPGGNITGLSAVTEDLSAKRLQLLKEALPGLTRVAVLWNPSTSFHAGVVEQLKAAASSLSIELRFVGVRTPEEIGPAFSMLSRARAQAVYAIEDVLFIGNRATLVKLASNAHLPIILPMKEFARGGGLLSYGPSFEDLMRRSAGYVDKILRGSKPGDLPIEQPTKFEFVVNLKTAKALGIAIPESVLLRADEVIQ